MSNNPQNIMYSTKEKMLNDKQTKDIAMNAVIPKSR